MRESLLKPRLVQEGTNKAAKMPSRVDAQHRFTDAVHAVLQLDGFSGDPDQLDRMDRKIQWRRVCYASARAGIAAMTDETKYSGEERSG